ncbi:unnamed protein product [Rotaria socialis]|uniref:Cyclic nucleotide-binding domain-containing protein n=1 Tax=Rotaria socialis TaxID=392032 RepID=A0A818DA12_9BILA|nr:unnamed protein product [Rotaria socialis]CAF4641848.1 unnamed protein product [Rotaria socialis]
MNFVVNKESYTYNKTPNFNRLIERVRQCIRERELEKQQHVKVYSMNHYAEHLKRCIHDSPSVGRALFQFYNVVKNFPSQNNRFRSTIILDNNESKMSLDGKTSIDYSSRTSTQFESKTNLTMSQSTHLDNLTAVKSTTHFIQPVRVSRRIGGLMTKTTLAAINKTPRQRTTRDIGVLEHLLSRCESLRHLPTNVRHYAARSLLFFTHNPNTILTRQNFPSFLVYIIVYGQCLLLLETNEKTLFGHRLNIGDVYGDDSLRSIDFHHLNGLITNENTHCNLIGFFSRDIKTYGNYLSDIMKQSLLEQFRMQSIFSGIQWRNDILNYILKWTTYKQYSIDEIVYGNEEYEHENLYFILHGQISFVRLFEFPSNVIKHPEYSQFYQKLNKKTINTKEQHHSTNHFVSDPLSSNQSPLADANSPRNINDTINEKRALQKQRTTWRFLEIFLLSNGHYFGFESTTIHSWYLTRSIVDIVSIPKRRFEKLGSFAPVIFEKLRQDFLDIFPSETFIRNSYIKNLQANKPNENEISKISNHKKQSTINSHNFEKIQWIPEQNILSKKITDKKDFVVKKYLKK